MVRHIAPERLRLSLLALLLAAVAPSAFAQQDNRIRFNEQDLWLSGANVAWVDFARDIGPGTTRLDLFEEMFREMRNSGGNTFRLWLHTSGDVTPEFEGSGLDAFVVGPGEGAIEDLRAILDLAHAYDISLQLCLWSFDMLVTSRGASITDRNMALLNDESRLQAYIDNALIPMVDSLKGHPAILAWEIFNEPEGMSNEFGWSHVRRTSMANIQRFVNRTAGAIHRTDADAMVTNGSWSFRASSDVNVGGTRYRNFYRDDRLIAAGGDEEGTLDFYNVHYYEHFGEAQSPFHREASFWGLDKPIVIGEFFLYDENDGNPDATFGIPWQEAYATLYNRGYAGALAWQWFDNYANRQPEWQNWPRALDNMQTMFDRHREAVELIYPGLRTHLSVDRSRVEMGDEVTISWETRGAETVTLNDEAVEPAGSRIVALTDTTIFVLVATDAEGATETREVTVEVVDPQFINRALNRRAVASSSEAGLGSDDPAFAVDGDTTTRWSSEWQENLADANPDDEWIYIDLGQAIDIDRVILLWENAHAEDYDLEVSYDARRWTTVHEVRSKTSAAADTVDLAEAPPARFVRMHGLTRATEWGFSLYEMEVYGTVADAQPPAVAIAADIAERVEAGQEVEVSAEVTHERAIEHVVFYVDGDSVATATTAPYSFTWDADEVGEYELMAIATDEDGLAGVSDLLKIEVETPQERNRYEDGVAQISGSDIERINDTSASGGTAIYMRDNGTITWSVEVAQERTYRMEVRYRLLDGEKTQTIVVNGETVGDLEFTGPFQEWLTTEIDVPLETGSNQIQIVKSWGWMYFDYIEIVGDGQAVSIDGDGTLAGNVTLGVNYPNPFNPSTIIPYKLPRASHVLLEVFDVMGRRVAILEDGPKTAGSHSVTFEAPHLASGIYFYRLEAGSHTQTRRMVLLK